MFMAERGVDIPKVNVDLRGGENRQAPHLARNPSGQTPALELDDGSCLAEITAICEYLDEISPGASLIGANAQERAETRMWMRRVDLQIMEPMANGFRFGEGLKLFENRIRCIPQASDDLKKTAQDRLAWLDKLMEGRTYICGDRLTMADILLFCFVDFFNGVGQPIDPNLKNIVAWHARMAARPSAKA
jgi:glutathione S-transferase